MSGLFKKTVSPQAPAMASLRLQTSCYGRPIPLVFGQGALAGNLGWYADFKSIPHTTSSGGKGGGGGGAQTTTTYTYQAAALMLLCAGPIVGIPAVWAGKKQTSLSALNLTLFLGTETATPFSYVTTKYPAQALAYRGLSYVGTGAYDLGESDSLPNHTFEIAGLLQYGSGIVDANPADVLLYLLTDPNNGAGFPAAYIGTTADNLLNFSNYCRANGIFVSPVYTEQEETASIIERLVYGCCNSAFVYSESMLKVIPFGDVAATGNGATYTPNITPIYSLTDSDFILTGDDDPVIVSRGRAADAFNQLQLTYVNREAQYADGLVEFKDQDNIEIYGLRPAPNIELKEIASTIVARQVVQLQGQRNLFIRNTYRFFLGWKYALLEPMDLLTLTESSGDGLSGVTVRIREIEEDQEGAGTFTCEDYLGAVASSALYSTQSQDGYAANYAVSPGTVNTPVIFDGVGRLAVSGFEVWMAIAGTDPNWGGAFIYASTDGGGSYSQVGKLVGKSRYGVATTALAVGVDPDVTNSVSVNFTTSKATIVTGSANDADNGNTLSLIDGELISYSNADLTSEYNYTFNGTTKYMRRGVFGTTIAAHSIGANFVRLDEQLFRYAYDPDMIGSTIHFKFLSFNIYGSAVQQLSDPLVLDYSYTIAGPIGAPPDVVGGDTFIANNGIELFWSPSSDPFLASYEVREVDSGWGDAAFLYRGLFAHVLVPFLSSTASKTWYVKAVDQSGLYSVNSFPITMAITAPNAPTLLTQEVVDNNVMLRWDQAALSSTQQPIISYKIYKNGSLIGEVSARFNVIFETLAGIYNYTIQAVDAGGIVGAALAVTATVKTPPNFVLSNNINSRFNGGYNNLSTSDKNTNATITDNIASKGAGTTWYSGRAFNGWSEGKWYWEVHVDASTDLMIGVGKSTASIADNAYPGSDVNGYGYAATSGNKFNNASSGSYGASYTAGDTIGVFLDMDAGTLSFYKNGVSQGVAYSGLTGTFYPMFGLGAANGQMTYQFGQEAFTYTPPSGSFNWTNADHGMLENGILLMPVDITTTTTGHFTNGNGAGSWASPQDQITAGFPVVINPTRASLAASGYYEEIFDAGVTLAASSAQMTLTAAVLGAPTVAVTMSYSNTYDSGYTSPVTVPTGGSLQCENFRFVKARVTVTRTTDLDLYSLSGMNFTLSTKTLTEGGSMTATWSGSNPKVLTFEKTFVKVSKITLTPMGSSAARFAVTDFDETTANPTTADIYLYDAGGGVPTGTFTIGYDLEGY